MEYKNKIKKVFNDDGLLILPFLGWLFFIIVAFLLALLLPPTEPDAQSYHCLRALFWLKDGFISHFEATDTRILCMPFNSEIFYLWILALSKNDIGFGLLQFFSYFLLIFSSFKIMEFFEIDIKKIVWSIIIFTSFPAIIIQIPSTQTDLIIAALFSYSIFLVLNYTKEKNCFLLYFASLSSALTFGVKTTAFFIAPVVFLWFIFLLKKDFIKFFSFFILNFLIFSSYSYILNYIDFGSFLSNNAFKMYNRFFGGIKAYIANIINYFIQFIDFSGLNLGKYVNSYILSFKNFLFNLFSIPDSIVEIDPIVRVNYGMDEQRGAFGILGFLLFLPCLFIALFNKKYRIFSLLFFIPFLILMGAMLYTVFGIRYIVAFVGLSFPVLCISYFKGKNLIKIIIILYAFFYLSYSSLFSSGRPFIYVAYNFIKMPSISNMQTKMRGLEYKFFGPALFSQTTAYKNAVLPYCKNGNKIGLFASYAQVYYNAKYLELENDCRIDVLNILHLNDYNLKEYEALVLLGDNSQQLDVINKKDISKPFINSKNAICAFFVSDRASDKDKNKIDAAIYAVCSMNKNYLNDLGFNYKSSYDFIDRSYDIVKYRKLEVYSK